MPNAFEVKVERGSDPNALGLAGKDRNDPSGFEKARFSKRDFEVLRESVRAGLQLAFQQAPEQLLQFAPRTIQLYSTISRRDFGSRASTLYDYYKQVSADFVTHQTPRGTRVEVTRYKIQPIVGVSSAYTPGEVRPMAPQIREMFYHEGVHVLTGSGVRFASSVSEAVACRMEELQFGPNRKAGNDQWSMDHMHATCGLRAPEDFAIFEQPEQANYLNYIAGPVALRFLTADKIWQLCAGAVENAQREKRLGSSADFAHIAKTVLPEDADRLLQSIPFRPIEYGVQQFVFRNRRPDRLLSFTFDIQPKPDYGYVTPAGVENHIAEWNVLPVQKMNLRPYVRGMEDPVSGVTFALEPQVALNFTDIANAVEQGTGQRVKACDVERITCSLGLQMLDLLPPEAGA